MIQEHSRRGIDLRTVAAAALAIAVGLGIAYLDSRPGWDDTGITALGLLIGAGVAAAVAGRRPWLWALLVGAWTPLLEIPTSGSTGSLLALAFAAVGAALGWLAVRAATSR